jgi:cation diffusion facilitator family transporter
MEGAANFVILAGKLFVGLSTGSYAVLGDAVHSLTDITNNLIAWGVTRLSSRPPDRSHPYGHRKFETLAVFCLATLLAVLAVELALHAIRREKAEMSDDPWALGIMIGVLIANILIALFQRYWARRLQSDILLADANHTFADVLTTIAVIGGWQMSVRGYPWMDTVCALGVAVLVMYLAYGLFRRALPALVDEVAIDAELVAQVAKGIPGVRGVNRIRSRWVGSRPMIDIIISVDPGLSTTDAHQITNQIEKALMRKFQTRDISIHVEPHE